MNDLRSKWELIREVIIDFSMVPANETKSPN